MTTTKLPPQAYTRETLAHAYEWLKAQPSNVRELAKSADELVNLYLHARRHRQSSDTQLKRPSSKNDAPVSSESFKKELVDLAKNFAEFEGDKQINFIEEPKNTPKEQMSHTERLIKESVRAAVDADLSTQAKPDPTPAAHVSTPLASDPQVASQQAESIPARAPEHTPREVQTAPAAKDMRKDLDPKSQLLLQITADKLNLSSEDEALRMLLTLGFERAKQIFPNEN